MVTPEQKQLIKELAEDNTSEFQEAAKQALEEIEQEEQNTK